MKRLVFVTLLGLLGATVVRAEKRVFTNSEGKKLEAEMVAVEGEDAMVRLSSGKIAKVPLKSLSADDQAWIAAWWKENKDVIKPMDVTLAITKQTDRIDRKVTRSGGNITPRPGQGNIVTPEVKKNTVDEYFFAGELKSYLPRDVTDIEVEYTIYKRISVSGKAGSDTKVEEIKGTTGAKLLAANGKATFETESVTCEDTSQTGGNKAREMKRETILGVVFELSAGGKEFLRQSHPENLLEHLEDSGK